MEDTLKNLLQMIVENLVDTPGEIKVEESGSVQTVVFRVTAAEGETGYLIGRGGCIAQAVRLLMNSVGRKHNKRVVVEFAGDDSLDPVGIEGSRARR
jgi:predicted RNA-binding protein YlqC (UPF0109 family)